MATFIFNTNEMIAFSDHPNVCVCVFNKKTGSIGFWHLNENEIIKQKPRFIEKEWSEGGSDGKETKESTTTITKRIQYNIIITITNITRQFQNLDFDQHLAGCFRRIGFSLGYGFRSTHTQQYRFV